MIFKNKKGQGMSTQTIVLIVLALCVLVFLIYILGWSKSESTQIQNILILSRADCDTDGDGIVNSKDLCPCDHDVKEKKFYNTLGRSCYAQLGTCPGADKETKECYYIDLTLEYNKDKLCQDWLAKKWNSLADEKKGVCKADDQHYTLPCKIGKESVCKQKIKKRIEAAEKDDKNKELAKLYFKKSSTCEEQFLLTFKTDGKVEVSADCAHTQKECALIAREKYEREGCKKPGS